MEYKEITTVGSASQLSEDATVFINDGGTLKQAPMSLLMGALSGIDPAALHFRGMLADLPEDVTSYDNGDVVIVGVKEFVFFNSAWYELGDASGSVVDTGTSGLCLVRISAEPGVPYKSDRTYAEVVEAIESGKTVLMVYTDGNVYPCMGMQNNRPAFNAGVKITDGKAQNTTIQITEDERVEENASAYFKAVNPGLLTIKQGRISKTYDGSSSVTAEVPDVLIVKMRGGNISSHTQQEVKNAYYEGQAILMVDPSGRVYTMAGVMDGMPVFHNISEVKVSGDEYTNNALLVYEAKLKEDGKFSLGSPNYSTTPNPYALTITMNGNETEYNGSSAVNIDLDAVADVGASSLYLVTCKNNMSNRTQEEIRAAVEAGKTCLMVRNGEVYTYYGEDDTSGTLCPTFARHATYEFDDGIYLRYASITSTQRVHEYAYAPAKTPNPHDLTFTGAVNTTYDGSSAVTVNIPFGGGDDGVSVQSDLAQNDPTSPDYVMNRTHYAEGAKEFPWHMTVDADAPAAMIYKQDGTDSSVRWVKVSDYTPDAERAVALATIQTSEGGRTKVKSENILDQNGNGYLIAREVYLENSGTTARMVYAVVCFNGGYVADGSPSVSYDGVATIPAPGLYLPVTSSGTAAYGIEFAEYVKLLDDKYISDNIARKEDLENIEIPDPVTDEHINSLIDKKLASSGGSQTILAETTAQGEEGQLFTMTPPESMPVVGNIYTVTYNGVPYDCSAIPLEEDGVNTGVALGNTDAMGQTGGNPDAPFVVGFPSEPIDIGGTLVYVVVMDLAGATSATIAIEGAGGSPNGKTQITLTIDDDGNVISDTSFETAWAMTPGELQAAIVIKETSNYKGTTYTTVDTVSKAEGGAVPTMYGGRMINIRVRKAFLDLSDLADKDTTRFLTWVEGGVVVATQMSYAMPILPVGQQSYVGRYARYNGSTWESVTIDQLKADLGLT